MFALHQIPVKNIKTHPVRTVILIVLTMLQVLSVFTGLMMIRSMQQELSLAEARLGADLLVYPTQAMSKISKSGLLMQGTPVAVYKPRSMLSRLNDCEGINAISYQIYLKDNTGKDRDIWIVGFDTETDFVIRPWLAEGTDFEIPDGSLIIGSKLDAAPDNTIRLFQETWPVSGHLLETGSELDQMIFVSMATLSELLQTSAAAGVDSYTGLDPQNTFSAALIRTDNKNNIESVTNWINIHVRKVNAIRSEAVLTSAAANIQGQIKITAVIAISAWTVLLLAQAMVQSMLMRERRREFYVWFTVGASRTKVTHITLSEALLTHLTGALIGILIGILLITAFGNKYLPGTGISRSISIFQAFLAIGLTALTACLSTLLAIRNTIRDLNGQMLLSL